MYAEGCTHVFMEVSSHAIDQHRVDGLSDLPVEFLATLHTITWTIIKHLMNT